MCFLIIQFVLFCFLEELLEDKDLKCITFISKDLTKVGNIYEKVLSR